MPVSAPIKVLVSAVRMPCPEPGALHHRLETTMRMMLKFTLPVEKGNQAFIDGSLGKTLESIMKKVKPEGSYFGLHPVPKTPSLVF